MKRITLDTFRKVARQEERMMRSVMPRISEQDAAVLETAFMVRREVLRTDRSGARLVKPLTYTLAEMMEASRG
jgi:hypothetical protein